MIINDSIVSWSSFWLFAWSNFGWSIWCSIGWYTTTNGLEIYGSGWFPAHAISKYVGNEGMYVIFTISAVLWTLEAAMAFALMFSARKVRRERRARRGMSTSGLLLTQPLSRCGLDSCSRPAATPPRACWRSAAPRRRAR